MGVVASGVFGVGIRFTQLGSGVLGSGMMGWAMDHGGGWEVQLERLGTFAWAAVHNWGAKGAPLGPNMLASSLGGGEREVKGTNCCSPHNVPGGSPTP